jgi:hypothetical protein
VKTNGKVTAEANRSRYTASERSLRMASTKADVRFALRMESPQSRET